MEKIVGFDIGESSVKLVYFAGADLKKAVTAELPDNMVSGSRILSMDAMADFLRQTAKSNGIPLTHAALVLPSTEVFTRELVMPAMTEQQLLYNLPYEFRDYLTEEKNKYFFDYSMREVLRDESGQPTEMNLLACATLKSTVESYRAMLRRAGFRLRVLTPSECAYSAVLQAYYRRTRQEGRDLCVVNLGHSATFLYIYRGGHFASRREIEVGMSDLEQRFKSSIGENEISSNSIFSFSILEKSKTPFISSSKSSDATNILLQYFSCFEESVPFLSKYMYPIIAFSGVLSS